jgi:pentose-5-phosphate-3-epimerase
VRGIPVLNLQKGVSKQNACESQMYHTRKRRCTAENRLGVKETIEVDGDVAMTIIDECRQKARYTCANIIAWIRNTKMIEEQVEKFNG